MCRSGAGCWSLSVAASCCGEVKIEIVRVEHCIYERRHDGSTLIMFRVDECGSNQRVQTWVDVIIYASTCKVAY